MTRVKLPLSLCIASAILLVVAAPAAAATFTVNNAGNLPDLTPDGTCEATSGGGDCTLRAAIDEANANMVDLDVISFTAGLDPVSPSPTGFGIAGPVTIDGNGSSGAGNTVIDGGDLVQLFAVASTAAITTFKDLRVQNALAAADAGAAGAAIRTDANTLLDNVVVTENTIDGKGDGRGAGVYSGSAGTLTVQNSVISDNEITSDANNNGAGISSDGPLTMTGSTVSGNDISDGTSAQGGGVLANAGFSVLSSTINNNTAVAGRVGEGGGLFNGSNPGIRAIANSTISGNTAADSGAGIKAGGDTSITGVTFLGNSGAAVGGQDVYAAAGKTTAKNTIFGSIGVALAGACSEGGGTIVAGTPGTNIDVGTSCNFDGSENQVNTPPLLGPLASNGGPTQTHAPLAGSPAIDMTSIGCGGLILDQRGISRPQGPLCDVGAAEVQYRLLTASKTGAGSGTVASAPTGISCGGDCSESYLPGASVTLTATPSAGSDFSSWSGCDITAGDQCTIALGTFALGSDRMVSASFSLEPAPPPPGGTPTAPTTPKKKKKKCKKKQSTVGAGAAKKKCKK